MHPCHVLATLLWKEVTTMGMGCGIAFFGENFYTFFREKKEVVEHV